MIDTQCRNLELISSDDRMAAFEPFGLKRHIPRDSGFMTNEEIAAYNAMAAAENP